EPQGLKPTYFPHFSARPPSVPQVKSRALTRAIHEMRSRVFCENFNLQSEEVFEEAEAGAGEDRLGMELDAFDAEFAVAKSHDCAVGGFGGNFQRARERFALDDQRMIARGLKILREAAT